MRARTVWLLAMKWLTRFDVRRSQSRSADNSRSTARARSPRTRSAKYASRMCHAYRIGVKQWQTCGTPGGGTAALATAWLKLTKRSQLEIGQRAANGISG